jgi:tripartite-type tricarboxylate transporter receptor subunit TctC
LKIFINLSYFILILFINVFIYYNTYAIEKTLYITIPAKENGGIDYIGRTFGEFIKTEKIVENVFYNNISGAAGGRGIHNFLNQSLKENRFIFLSMDMHISFHVISFCRTHALHFIAVCAGGV